MNSFKLAALAGFALLASAPASAGVVSGFTNALVVENFDALGANGGFVTSTSQSLAGGLVTATANTAVTYTGFPLELGTNGAWGLDGYAAIGDFVTFESIPSATDSLTFTFASGQVGVGAEFNIFRDAAEGFTSDILLEALDLNGGVLKATTFTVDFGDIDAFNAFVFKGFFRGQGDIFGLRVTGDGFVVDNLTTAVPVPAALPLMLGAMGLLGATRRKRA